MGVIWSQNKHQEGFLLIESLLALTVVTLALAVYSPSTNFFLRRVTEEKEQTTATRLVLEEARRARYTIEHKQLLVPASFREVSRAHRLEDDTRRTQTQGGIRVTYGNWTETITMLEKPHPPKETVPVKAQE